MEQLFAILFLIGVSAMIAAPVLFAVYCLLVSLSDYSED